jgi:hypothetical protein
MTKIFFTIAFIFSGLIFAQEASISIEPNNFKNTILLSADVQEKTNLTIEFSIDDKAIKQITLEDVTKKSFKIDLRDLEQNKTYLVKVYNAKNKLLFTDKIIKSLKY